MGTLDEVKQIENVLCIEVNIACAENFNALIWSEKPAKESAIRVYSLNVGLTSDLKQQIQIAILQINIRQPQAAPGMYFIVNRSMVASVSISNELLSRFFGH